MTRSPTRLGMLTPSSNTTLEPVTSAMLRHTPDITAHFGRFKVTEIALSDAALKQFDDSEILYAAELLADAKVDAIAWNGTSASWLGLERDERLVERIERATGIKACTCVLACRELLLRLRANRIGLVTPYTEDVQGRIGEKWAAAGLSIAFEQHLGIRDNFAFAEVSEEQTEAMIRQVHGDGCDAAVILCTNINAAALAARLEPELRISILDSVAVTLWKCLTVAGIAPTRIEGWGSLFAMPVNEI
jgi:maleate isomerase